MRSPITNFLGYVCISTFFRLIFYNNFINFFLLLKILDWLIHVNDPREIWKAQPTYLISEWAFITVGILTFIHCTYLGLCTLISITNLDYQIKRNKTWSHILAQRVGGRFKWLWFATILHALFVENVTFWTPEINNFWHSQTTIVLFGRRLPLHILTLCKSSFLIHI